MVSLDVMVMEPADVNLSEEQYLQYFKQSSLEDAISYSNRSRALHVVHHTRSKPTIHKFLLNGTRPIA